MIAFQLNDQSIRYEKNITCDNKQYGYNCLNSRKENFFFNFKNEKY